MENWWIVVLSVVVPLLIFMLALLPWIKSVVKGETKELGERVAKMEGRLDAMEKSMEGRWVAMEKYLKELIPLYRSLPHEGKPGNPGPRKEELLMKLENDTITWEEADELQRIMQVEGQKARDQNDILKAIIIIGILALIAAALARQKG